MTRRTILLLIGLVFIAATGVAVSPLGTLIYMNVRGDDAVLAGWQDYRAMNFEYARRSGEPTLVEVYASWCPSCFIQHRALENLQATGRIPRMTAFRVDFDRDKDFLARHKVQATSTLILFEDGREVARSYGLTEPDAIEAFVTANLAKRRSQKTQANL